jgi:hypothetical protein
MWVPAIISVTVQGMAQRVNLVSSVLVSMPPVLNQQ